MSLDPLADWDTPCRSSPAVASLPMLNTKWDEDFTFRCGTITITRPAARPNTYGIMDELLYVARPTRKHAHEPHVTCSSRLHAGSTGFSSRRITWRKLQIIASPWDDFEEMALALELTVSALRRDRARLTKECRLVHAVRWPKNAWALRFNDRVGKPTPMRERTQPMNARPYIRSGA